eukprot:Skav200689  [mRNA]  locus=scaffold1446:500415:500726:- [translate_table: standard]
MEVEIRLTTEIIAKYKPLSEKPLIVQTRIACLSSHSFAVSVQPRQCAAAKPKRYPNMDDLDHLDYISLDKASVIFTPVPAQRKSGLVLVGRKSQRGLAEVALA